MFANLIFQLSKSQTLRRRADNTTVKCGSYRLFFLYIQEDNNYLEVFTNMKLKIVGSGGMFQIPKPLCNGTAAALSIARGAGRRVRGDFSPRRTSDKHQRRRWAGPTHGHDPPVDRLAACPSGPPFPVAWGCRAEYGCLWTGQGNGRGTP